MMSSAVVQDFKNSYVLNANRGGPSLNTPPKSNHSHVTPNPDRVRRACDSSLLPKCNNIHALDMYDTLIPAYSCDHS